MPHTLVHPHQPCDFLVLLTGFEPQVIESGVRCSTSFWATPSPMLLSFVSCIRLLLYWRQPMLKMGTLLCLTVQIKKCSYLTLSRGLQKHSSDPLPPPPQPPFAIHSPPPKESHVPSHFQIYGRTPRQQCQNLHLDEGGHLMKEEEEPLVCLDFFSLKFSVCCFKVLSDWKHDYISIDDPACTCAHVCVPQETIKVIIKLGTVTVSDMRMHHVLIIFT